jgi:hypothetical protein
MWSWTQNKYYIFNHNWSGVNIEHFIAMFAVKTSRFFGLRNITKLELLGFCPLSGIVNTRKHQEPVTDVSSF